MNLYYRNLENIEKNLCKSKLSAGEKKILLDYVEPLDRWLISRSPLALNRLNPYQFALDQNITNNIAVKLFSEGTAVGLLEPYFEVETDEKETIGLITTEQYKQLNYGGSIILESPISEDNVEIFKHNVNIYFAVKKKPISYPEFLPIEKKQLASAFKGDDPLFDRYFGR